mmetsp:Transcript_39197/g.54421  ORF Transcript_39197/g.54421 Transcript_39197/m.54421 type:complete len:311 (-) Transcript_39197:258-1190(-)|eukprot:CAMPEP_0196572530 /NCGR_PEP_ID=MMETSP1081-20130531/2568_1 /TAXON_ID=36882 /ORGANISM="Pyramimonas amylifera, Strain CCMP720" /LENGTH=310 /DNA_ID=CAMNT_0041889885 /DNA_START=270 /DNA_END=1202 /DNA_ORIENTATION=+
MALAFMFKSKRKMNEETCTPDRNIEADFGFTDDKISKSDSDPRSTLRSNQIKSFKAEGIILAEKGKFKEALAKWQHLLEYNPVDSSVHELCAQALLELNEPWQAIHAAQRAARSEPNNVDAYVTLGRAQLHLGDKRLAAKSLVTAMNLDRTHSPDHTDMHQARKYLHDPNDPCQVEVNLANVPNSKNMRISTGSHTSSRNRLAYDRLFNVDTDSKHQKSNDYKSSEWPEKECRQDEQRSYEWSGSKKVTEQGEGSNKSEWDANNGKQEMKPCGDTKYNDEPMKKNQREFRGPLMFNLNEQVEKVCIEEET